MSRTIVSKSDVERQREMLEPPHWGVNHPTHMAGWEAFGVVGASPPTVRRLGTGFGGKGKPGTEKWHPSEVRDGVASIEIGTFADHPSGAYIVVYGTSEKSVADRWHAAAAVFQRVADELWPLAKVSGAGERHD